MDDVQIVRNEEIGQPQLVLQVLEEVDDLRLDGDVQGGDRLVADDELRVRGQGARDADALPLSAGELVRIVRGHLRIQAAHLHEAFDLLRALGAVCGQAEVVDGLGDDVARAQARVQRGIGILPDELHLLDVGAALLGGEGGDVLSLVEDLAARRAVDVQKHLADGGLAAAALAHDAERLALGHGEGDVVRGVDPARRPAQGVRCGGEVHGQPFGLEEVVFVRFGLKLLGHRAAPPFCRAWRQLWQATVCPLSASSKSGKTSRQVSLA